MQHVIYIPLYIYAVFIMFRTLIWHERIEAA
jgi:hypothetical protein